MEGNVGPSVWSRSVLLLILRIGSPKRVSAPPLSVSHSPSLVTHSSMKSLFYRSLLPAAISEYLPPHPLPTVFSSKHQCISTYGDCMQYLAQSWHTKQALDLSICDPFQAKCDSIYHGCQYIEIPLHSLPHQTTETEKCMATYDQCLNKQGLCEKSNSTECPTTSIECDEILQSCHNP